MGRDELINSVSDDGAAALAAVMHALHTMVPLPINVSVPESDESEEIAAALDSMQDAARVLRDLPMSDPLRRAIQQGINMWMGGICLTMVGLELGDGPLYAAEALFSYTQQSLMVADDIHRGRLPEAEETSPDEIAYVQYSRANKPVRRSKTHSRKHHKNTHYRKGKRP